MDLDPESYRDLLHYAPGRVVGFHTRTSGGKGVITISSSPSLSWTNGAALTWSAWINFAAAQPDATIFSRKDGANAFRIGVDNGVPFVEVSGAGGTQRTPSGAAITPKSWRHLAVVAEGQKITLFLDGDRYGVINVAVPALKFHKSRAENMQLNLTDKLFICYCFVMLEKLPNTDTALASKLAAELRTTFGQLKRKLRQHGGLNDFTSSQITVLLRLEKDGPATVSSLARAEGMRPQSMSAVIAPLEERGFVAGAADPNDGRKTLMSLTKACKKWIEDGRAARQDWLTQAIQRKLSPQEQKKLSSAIHLLAQIAED